MHPLQEQLSQIPFMRLAIALLCGIVWQTTAAGFGFPTLFIAVGLVVVYIALFFIHSLNGYTRQWISGSTGLLCLFFIGVTLVQQQATTTSLPLGEKVWLQTEICDTPIKYDRYIKTQAIVLNYATATDTAPANEKVILYLAADSLSVVPRAGTTLYTNVRLSLIPPPGNPEEFDYQQFLARKKIFASAFVQQGNYFTDATKNKSLLKTLQYLPVRWQQSGLKIFRNSPLGEKEYAVLSALTLGNKQFLDDDLRTSYMAAGAMHILAVSGLHVGIIMTILSFAFSFLSKRRHGLLVKHILIIICLWLYAAIVGFSPSVTRATVMFSFILIGKTMQREISIYNSLAASAFFICLFNPLVVFDAGFQLSYCAVLSIVYFQPHLNKLWYVKNKWLRSVWNLATVSIAAQIGTLPISLLNFHLFPNYFLLTNICIITLTGFIVYAGTAFLIAHQIPVVSTIAGYVLQGMLWLLNTIVEWIESLPHSTVSLYIDKWQMLLLIIIVLLVALYLYFPRRRWLWYAAFAVTGIAGIHSLHVIARKEQRMVVVYKVKNASCIQFINGTGSVTVRDEKNTQNDFSFNTAGLQIKRGLASQETSLSVPVADTSINGVCCYRGFIIFQNKRYKILAQEPVAVNRPPIPTDYLIVTGATQMKPYYALQHYQPGQIIIDASVPFYRAKQWIAAAQTANTPIHNIREQGAFTVNRPVE